MNDRVCILSKGSYKDTRGRFWKEFQIGKEHGGIIGIECGRVYETDL